MPDTLRTAPVSVEDHLAGGRQADIHHDNVDDERSRWPVRAVPHDRRPADLPSRLALRLGGEPSRIAVPDGIDDRHRDADAR